MLFRALGVLGDQRIQLDGAILGQVLLQLGEGVLLVQLNAQLDLGNAKDLGQQLTAADHFPGVLQHDAMVRSDIGFALCTVDDNGVHLAQTGRDLDGSGEGSAAVTDDAGLTNSGHDLFRGHGVDVQRLDGGILLVLEIVFNDDAHDAGAEGIGTGLDSHNRTGDGGVDGSANGGLRVSDFLSQINVVAYLNKGFTGSADVHRHGQNHLRGSR